MDTKTKIFWLIMGLLIFLSFSFSAYRYLIKKDYIIRAETDCDPYTETCFVWQCDPSSEEEGEKCTGDPEADIWYYKIINRNASRIPMCGEDDEDCQALICGENEPDCEYVLCNEENKSEMESEYCTDPVKYSLENPIEEECEEGDEECLNEEDSTLLDESEEDVEEDPAIQTTDDAISSEENVEEEEDLQVGDLPIVQ